jgi:hypothetical protein
VYLEYEGDISGGRGTVRRVALGSWQGDLLLTTTDGMKISMTISRAEAARTA